MKKGLNGLLIMLAFVLVLAGCGKTTTTTDTSQGSDSGVLRLRDSRSCYREA